MQNTAYVTVQHQCLLIADCFSAGRGGGGGGGAGVDVGDLNSIVLSPPSTPSNHIVCFALVRQDVASSGTGYERVRC